VRIKRIISIAIIKNPIKISEINLIKTKVSSFWGCSIVLFSSDRGIGWITGIFS